MHVIWLLHVGIQCDLTLFAIDTQWPISIERISLFINKLWLTYLLTI
jgi:hypothetical protein